MIADIIPLVRLPRRFSEFSYKVPTEIENEIAVGQCVRMPFREKNILGIVTNIRSDEIGELKKILSIVNKVPLLGADYLDYLEKLARMYGVSRAILLRLALPALQPKKIKDAEIQEWIPAKENSKKPEYRQYATQNGCESALLAHASEKICIIVPEISLIDSVMRSLSPDRQKETLVWTSELSVAKKRSVWFSIRNHTARTMIAARGAVWMPLHQSFDRVIIESEHSEHHKHWNQSPRYSSKDVLKLLSRNFGIKYAEMSYSPSVSSYYFTRKGMYAGTAEIVRGGDLPTIVQESGKAGKMKLQEKILRYVEKALLSEGDALIIYNRKDFEPDDFGGIEKNPRVILSTRQMIVELDWKKISIVVLVDFDDQLCFPEYSACELVWHEIQTVLFSKKRETPFLIQTKQPEHPLLLALAKPEQWYTKELRSRSSAGYPPFSYLARYCLAGKTPESARENAEKFISSVQARLTKSEKKIIIQGPIPADPQYHLSDYWSIVVLKISESDILSAICEMNDCLPPQSLVKIDPNPISLLNPR